MKFEQNFFLKEVVMNKAGITELDRPCVEAARQKEEKTRSFSGDRKSVV